MPKDKPQGVKKILIIYPHWPPSNLAGVHRARLLANFLPEFGWQPVVLTVHARHYEEAPDPDLVRTVAPHVDVRYADAWPVTRPRLIGDIGLRALFHLRRAAAHILRTERIDFVLIPIPSYYVALLGRWLHDRFGVPYGIDYIDPWSEGIPGAERRFSRAWWSNQLARRLEPWAVGRAALISGVATPYYQYVLDRFLPGRAVAHVGMPYGFDPADHRIRLTDVAYPWADEPGVRPWVYAGAFLPKSRYFVERWFAAIAELVRAGQWDACVRLYFVGTGAYPGTTIAQYAAAVGIADYVREDRSRYPYLQVLNFLAAADGVLILGSTEAHYTASKTFQVLLSERPVLAIFHAESSAVQVLEETRATAYLVRYRQDMSESKLTADLRSATHRFAHRQQPWQPDLAPLERFSARVSAQRLAEKLDILTTAQPGQSL